MKYVVKEVRLTLGNGAELVADVDSLEAVEQLLADLRARKLGASTQLAQKQLEPDERRPRAPADESAGPAARLETRAGLTSGDLARRGVLAFKDDVPQLLRPGTLSTTDAILVLLLSVESGLGKPKIDYEAFKQLYEAQNIKSGSPLAMRLTDLRNAGYLDKKLYSSEKSLRLTAKGERKAADVLKQAPSR